MGVVKNKCDHLGAGTLKLAASQEGIHGVN